MPIPVVLTEDYNYDLPQDNIAQRPLAQRDASKLLVYKSGACITDTYKNIVAYLPSDALMIFNNSKVIPARLLYVKDTSGIIELFCLEPKEGTPYEALQHCGHTTWTCMIGGLKKWRKEIPLEWKLSTEKECIVQASFVQADENGFEIDFSWTDLEMTFADILDCLGQMPIPPYLLRKAEQDDTTRYQTVYATVEGSVAAPTAGLHFTEHIMTALSGKNITQAFTTLHVGAGTFKPVNASYAHEHPMHAEWIEADMVLIEQLATSKKIIAVGTTSLRTVESLYWFAVSCMQNNALHEVDFVLPQFCPYQQDMIHSKEAAFTFLLSLLDQKAINRVVFKTELMILPGYQMKVAGYLVTNFHQPKSTLLMLVNAFTKGNWKRLYDYALHNDYRFLSFGDGCLLQWEDGEPIGR
jgi:S-adenosylmethionine:tRNA ribosyltransferase-isomerase